MESFWEVKSLEKFFPEFSVISNSLVATIPTKVYLHHKPTIQIFKLMYNMFSCESLNIKLPKFEIRQKYSNLIQISLQYPRYGIVSNKD